MAVSSPWSCDEVAGVLGDRLVGIVVDLGTGDDGQPLVEQVRQRADDARLGLAPLPQEDDVVPGQEGVLQLRHHGGLVAEHPVEQGLAGGDLGDGVAADLLLHGERLPAGLAELTEGGGARGHGGTLPPPSRGTSFGRLPTRPPTAGPSPADGPARDDLRCRRVWTCPAPGAPHPPTTTSAVRRSSPSTTTTRGSGCRSPVTGGRCRRSRRATARSSTAPASTSSAAPTTARHWLALDGLFYQGDVWLDGAYLGDPEGYFVPHAYDITDLAGLSSEHSLFIEVDVQPAAGPGRQAQHHRRLPALGLHRRRLEPRRPVAPRPAWSAPGPCASPSSGSCATRPTTTGRCCSCTPSSTRPTPARCGCAPSSTTGSSGTSPTASLRGVNEVTWQFGVDNPALWWPWSLGAQPLTHLTVEVFADDVLSHATRVPDRSAPGRAPPLDLHRQRRAAVREGREPRPDPPGAGRGHARRAPPRHRPGPRGRARSRAGPRPREPGRALRRGRRAGDAGVAGLPAAVGLRPQHPPPGHAPGPGDGEPARAPPLGRRLVRPQRAAAPRRRGRPAARRLATSGATPWARCSRRGTARSSTSG